MKFSSATIAFILASLSSTYIVSAQDDQDFVIQMDGEDVAIPLSSQKSYDSGQDERMKRPVLLSADGREVTLEGNTFRAFPFPEGPTSIGAQTTLDFDFTLTEIEEIHAICMDNDLRLSSSKCFVLAGTQRLSSSWKRLEPETDVGETRHYTIPIGEYFSGASKFPYIMFFQDNDSRDRNTGSSSFANIEINYGPDLFIEQDGAPIEVINRQQRSFGRRQDSSGYPLHVSADEKAVQLQGNIHRSIPLSTNVTIDKNTNIDFDFTLVDKRDVHALCFTVGYSSGSTCLVTANTQRWGKYNLSPKTEVGETRHYSVPLGLYFTGTFNYLTFMQDNDTRCRSCGDATWANIKLSQVTRPTLSITAYGEVHEIGLADQYSARDDQDTPANFLEFPDSTSVTVKGNTHKALPLAEPIMINQATDLDFDFTLVELEEVHSICIVTNEDVGKYFSDYYCFTPAYTQNLRNDKKLLPLTTEGETRHYHYPIGRYVPEGEAKYIVFMLDNDTNDRSTGEMTFANIEFTQRPSFNVDIRGAQTPFIDQQFSYHTRQDTSSNMMEVSETGDRISLRGNLWKAFAFPTPMTVTDDTVLSFTLEVEEVTDFTALCLDDDLREGNPARCLKLAGTQKSGLGSIMYRGIKQTYEGETKSYIIKLSEFYTGEMNFLVFLHDNDSSDRSTGISHISNLRIYDQKPSCITDGTFDFDLSECTVENFVEQVGNILPRLSGCEGDADPWEELMTFFDVNSDTEIKKRVENICDSAYATMRIPFNQLMVQEKQFTNEFFDGGNIWNYETDENRIGGPNLGRDAARVKVISDQLQSSQINIGFPDAHNFDDCNLRAAMCCYVAGRNGGEPVDNSDACYMDFTKARQSSHVRDGYSIYTGNGDEGPLTCHGFAWGDDAGYGDAAFRGNTLFQVAMKHALLDEGDVEELPGAPMCGCIEQMPVVTRADCTKTIVSQSVSVSYSPSTQFVVEARVDSVRHDDCGDLSTHYESLVAEGKASATEKALLDKHLVGTNQCGPALTDFLKTKGFEFN